jgi:hypothetical protein
MSNTSSPGKRLKSFGSPVCTFKEIFKTCSGLLLLALLLNILFRFIASVLPVHEAIDF